MATAEVDLTESQIDTLLREAEERLAAKSSAAELAASRKSFQVASLSTSAKQEVAARKAAEELKAKKAINEVTLYVPQQDKSKDKKKNPDNAGADWFNLPKTHLTPEAKRDFQILRMRGVLDAKHHFRKDTRKDLIPKFSVFGTVVEGAMEGPRARLTRKERKQTIMEEVLASREAAASFKKRYDKIQEKKTSGRKAFYKKLVAQRRRRP
ncbi:nucleolus protein required for cell [Niveomyces insectorum RCEF 264]|uniref:Nucleolus protein required for cell n=1 Tax=Niveomyces insectorum RCEF 264 TaxID=1081102 RepID=A0A167NJ17_9HYPO|nr:nucleolus protein required for cell [Niveomyces insectorum RCEF 264]